MKLKDRGNLNKIAEKFLLFSDNLIEKNGFVIPPVEALCR
jgi:hypothetical protein